MEVAVAPVRRGDFVISVRTRGDIKSAKSSILKAPPAPGLRIVHLAAQGLPVKKGDVVVEFDGMQQEQNVIQQTMQVAVRSRARSTSGSRRPPSAINTEADAMSKMQSEYGVESAKLDASKADVVSAIEGQKSRISGGCWRKATCSR